MDTVNDDDRHGGDWDLPARGWTLKSNKTLKEWMEKSRGSYIMYWKASQMSKRKLMWLTIPTLILSVFAGVAGIDSVWQDDGATAAQKFLRGFSAVTTLVVAALANIVTFLDPKVEAEKFKHASDKFQDISARLRTEYDRDPSVRTPHSILMNRIVAWFTDIHESTPPLPMSIIENYSQRKSSGKPAYNNPYLPDIMIPIGNLKESKLPRQQSFFNSKPLNPIPPKLPESPVENESKGHSEGYNPEQDVEDGVMKTAMETTMETTMETIDAESVDGDKNSPLDNVLFS